MMRTLVVAVSTVGLAAASVMSGLDASPGGRPLQGKEFRIGEAIPLEKGVTLKVIRGTEKTASLLAPELREQGPTLVFELAFEADEPPAGAGYPIFSNGPSEDPSKSDVVLLAGADRLAPAAVVSLSPDPADKAGAGRVTDLPLSRTTGKRVGFMMLKKGRTTVAFGFEPTTEQLGRSQKLLVSFELDQRYSVVINIGAGIR